MEMHEISWSKLAASKLAPYSLAWVSHILCDKFLDPPIPHAC